MSVKKREEYMSPAQWRGVWAQQKALRKNPVPRTHRNCVEATGVARPGKTAKDRALRLSSR